MARFNLLVLFTVALASGFAAATPIAEVQDMTPNIQARSSFQYRFYTTGNCAHDAPASSTFPRNDGPPNRGQTGGTCYNAPTSAQHTNLEIDASLSGVITFCNINCQGAGSVPQSGTHCFSPFPGCAIGSFKVT